MKTQICLIAIATLLFSGSGLQAQPASGGKKILVAYFSRSGNTRAVAGQIAKATGADIFEIQPATAYPEEDQATVSQAKKEINSGLKPALKAKVENMASYDVIFIGSPCWWSTVAPPVASFLAAYDLSGKTIVPFMTHEGSRMGHSEADIKKLCPQSAILKGLPVRGSTAGNAQGEVHKWLREMNMIK